MSVLDPIGDMLTRIRNAQERGKSKVFDAAFEAARARARGAAARGLSSAASPPSSRAGGKAEIEIELKYFDGAPVIREIKRVSKPGRRIYASVDEPADASITALAFPSSRRRRASCPTPKLAPQNVGGEVLCTVF